VLLLTLRGTPTLYYGDELGMHNVPIPPDRVRDPFEKNVPGLGLGRDPERTPMQWSSTEGAGFTHGAPWLPIADDASTFNVEVEMRDSHSMLNLYRRLIELRRREAALAIGDYVAVPASGDVLAYRRQFESSRFLVVLNFSNAPTTFQSAAIPQQGKIALSTYMDRDGDNVAGSIDLRASEAVIVQLTEA
jgi:alpha-glucosidase